jgi:type IV secretion system protein VirB10
VNATLPLDHENSSPVDPPPEDINSIGAREKKFPLVLFLVGALVLLLFIAAAAVWIRTAAPFATTKKEDYPSKKSSEVSEPGATAPKLEIAETSTPPPPPSSVPEIQQAPATPATRPAGVPAPTGNGPCPVTAVLDKTTQKPLTDARGLPVTVDCRGVYSSNKGPGDAAKNTTGTPAETPPSAPPDRYAGEAILSRQLSTKADARAVLPGLTQLPAPPVGASDVLKQLQALQSGQAVLSGAPTPNPLGNAQSANRPAGTPNTQGPVKEMLGAADKTDRVFAAKAIDENLVIPKGTQIDCGLTTRAVTGISGFASCLITRDVYSANGRVLLIERMSTVDGEYAAQSQAGQKYIHVLWTRVRKPGGVTIDIASPATDGLGGAGIPAFVDNRWMERLGAAYLLSFIKDVIAYKTATDSQTGESTAASVAYQNTTKTSEALAEQVLATTIGIKPILYANQGDRVAIYVARDLDFSKIYEVRPR